MSRHGAIIVGLAAALAAGCVEHQVGTFVREVYVYRYDLVVEKCQLAVSSDSLEVGQCWREQRRLPVTDDLPPTLSKAQIVAGSERARAGLVACGRKHQVSGAVPVRLKISYSGHLLAVEPRAGGEDFAACVGEAFEEAEFPASAHGAELSLQLNLPRSDSAGDEPAPSEPPATNAAPLSKAEILAGLSIVKLAIPACRAKDGRPGTVYVTFVISPSGSVATAKATGSYAGTPTGSCVEDAVKTATFPAIPAAQSVSFPFVLP